MSDNIHRTDDVIVTENVDFLSLLLPKDIEKGLLKAGFLKPSPIQLRAIPLGRCGCDLIVQAKSGTGKTCVFTVIALEKIVTSLHCLQAIIIAPTREIALQIRTVIATIGHYIADLKVEYFVGGTAIANDIENCKGCHIAVGAPGRISHLIKDGYLKTDNVRLVIFDEADKLMETTFLENIKHIYSTCSDIKQVIACSATYSPDLISFLGTYMKSCIYVTPTADPESLLLGIKQFVCILGKHTNNLAIIKHKETRLLYLLSRIIFNQCIVFSNNHSRAKSICNMLERADWPATCIYGRQKQSERFLALNDLRTQRVRILVTTDLIARGIDIDNVTLIINLDVPVDYDTYLHRMGRAGRFGAYGSVITIVIDGDELIRFQKMLGSINGSKVTVNVLPYQSHYGDLPSSSIDSYRKINGIEPAEQNQSSKIELSFDIATNLNEHNQFISKSGKICQENQEKYCGTNSTLSLENNIDKYEHIRCRCGNLEIDPKSILEVTDETLYGINEEYPVSNQLFPVCKNKLLLDIPLIITKGKLIRLQKMKTFKFKNNLNLNYDTNSVIKNIYKLRDVNIKSLKKQGISKSEYNLVNNFVNAKEEKVDLIQHKIQEIKEKEIVLLKLYRMTKTYDVVGWMTLDENFNLRDVIQLDNTKMIKLELIKCQNGRKHIKMLKMGNLLKENEHSLAIETGVNYAFDITTMPSKLLNKSLSDILNYFDSSIFTHKPPETIRNKRTFGNKSNTKTVRNYKNSENAKDSEKHNLKCIPVESAQKYYDNDVEFNGSLNSHIINNSADISGFNQRSNTVEVEFNNSYAEVLQDVNRAACMDKYEQWHLTIQRERKSIEYYVYISSMMNDLK